MHSRSSEILGSILDIIDKYSAFYVTQSPALLPFLFREKDTIEFPAYKNIKGIDEVKVRRLLRSSTLHFSSVEGWLDFSRTCDLSFGMRIHGNMVPLQAGVPSLLIGHDSRTTGLGKKMALPTITPDKYLSTLSNSPSNMLKYIAIEMKDYDEKRKSLAKEMLYFLTQNNCQPSVDLIKLCF
jgi:hypothetical protein